MERIANFEKVSYEQFEKDWKNTFGLKDIDARTRREIESIYYGLELPTRATAGSAGYDFVSPASFELKPGETVKIPTGIRCWIEDGWVLQCYPRSGLGFKYRLQLDNTVGIIDSDYAYSDNEGHIFIKLTNDTHDDKTLFIKRGDKFAQGLFIPYGITVDDNCTEVRNGGFGSTGE